MTWMPPPRDRNEIHTMACPVYFSINHNKPLGNSFGIIQSEAFAAGLGAP